MLILTDENFKKEIESAEKPVLVDFWSEHCLPCFMLFPTLEKLANDFHDKVIFAKLNIDNSPLIANQYGIDRIPFVILFNKTKPIAGFVGVQAETIIREWLEKNINGENNHNRTIPKIR